MVHLFFYFSTYAPWVKNQSMYTLKLFTVIIKNFPIDLYKVLSKLFPNQTKRHVHVEINTKMTRRKQKLPTSKTKLKFSAQVGKFLFPSFCWRYFLVVRITALLLREHIHNKTTFLESILLHIHV